MQGFESVNFLLAFLRSSGEHYLCYSAASDALLLGLWKKAMAYDPSNFAHVMALHTDLYMHAVVQSGSLSKDALLITVQVRECDFPVGGNESLRLSEGLRHLVGEGRLGVCVAVEAGAVCFFDLFLAVAVVANYFRVSSNPGPDGDGVAGGCDMAPFGGVRGGTPTGVIFARKGIAGMRTSNPSGCVPRLVIVIGSDALDVDVSGSGFGGFGDSGVGVSVADPILYGVGRENMKDVCLGSDIGMASLSVDTRNIKDVRTGTLVTHYVGMSRRKMNDVGLGKRTNRTACCLRKMNDLGTGSVVISSIMIRRGNIKDISYCTSKAVGVDTRKMKDMGCCNSPQIAKLGGSKVKDIGDGWLVSWLSLCVGLSAGRGEVATRTMVLFGVV